MSQLHVHVTFTHLIYLYSVHSGKNHVLNIHIICTSISIMESLGCTVMPVSVEYNLNFVIQINIQKVLLGLNLICVLKSPDHYQPHITYASNMIDLLCAFHLTKLLLYSLLSSKTQLNFNQRMCIQRTLYRYECR